MAETPQATPASGTPAPVVQTNVEKAVPAVPKAPDAKAAPVVEDAWDVMIDGKPVKKSKKEILESYQLRQLSDKRRSEADKVLQDYQQLYGILKTDPVKFLKAAGIDFDNLSTSYISKKAQEAMMDPRDRELQAAKAEAEQYKKWVAEQKSTKEQADKAAAVQQERERINKEIIEAIEAQKELGFPVDEELIIRTAQQMMIQDKAKKPLDAKEALPKVYQKTQGWMQGVASKMDGEKLVAWLGQDVANKIRKYDLGQLKAKRNTLPVQPSSSVKPAAAKKEQAAKPMTWSQWKAKQ